MTSSHDTNPGDATCRRDGEARPDTQGAVALVVVVVVLAGVRLGLRASWLLDHRPVFNDRDEEIGHIDDLVFEDDRVSYVIIGAFLGVGERKVALPYSSLQIDDRIVLPNATREALKALPNLSYDA